MFSALEGEFGEVGVPAVGEVDDVVRFGASPVLVTFRVDTSFVAYGGGELLQR